MEKFSSASTIASNEPNAPPLSPVSSCATTPDVATPTGNDHQAQQNFALDQWRGDPNHLVSGMDTMDTTPRPNEEPREAVVDLPAVGGCTESLCTFVLAQGLKKENSTLVGEDGIWLPVRRPCFECAARQSCYPVQIFGIEAGTPRFTPDITCNQGLEALKNNMVSSKSNDSSLLYSTVSTESHCRAEAGSTADWHYQ